ncbi:MAG: hypothetical protein HY736_19740 [Verrucomicrobia bacterium]|nr:hypothetical protein [Verrucomicrobiota bacterium]
MKPNTWSRPAVSALAAAVALLGAGCATTHEVKVTSICRPTPANRDIASFNVRTRTRVAEEDTLRYKEAVQHIRTALSAKGLYEAPTAASADMIVEIDYGIAPPRVKYAERERAVFAVPGHPTDGRHPWDPTKEMVGYESTVYPVVIREKHLSIYGRENKPWAEGQPPGEIWRVEVCDEDESQDLRGHLPILASAAMNEIGRNTDGPTTTTLRENDEAVRFIKKGL